MKKFLFIVLAMAVALSFGAPAMAKKGLSVGLGIGILPNCSSLGNTIVDDGLDTDVKYQGLDLTNPLAPVPINGYDNLVIIPAEDSLKDQETRGEISDLETSGPMTAIDLGIQIRYDFLNYLFVRTGFNYAKKIMGGETTWKKGGVENSQEWDYYHWSIPLTIGLNVPIADGKFNVYLGFSAAFMKGGWEATLKRSYLSSTNDGSPYIVAPDYSMGGAVTFLINALDGGVAKETAKFEVSGIAMGYVLGIDAEIMENISVFVEVESLVYGNYDEYKVKDAALKAAGIDLFNKYTVVGGSFLRFGAKYNLGFGTI